MSLAGVPVAEISWQQWWLIGSGALLLVGLIGWQLAVFFAGARVIVDRKDGEPGYSVIESGLLAGWLSNRRFKRLALRRAGSSRIGGAFFWLFMTGLGAQAAFWVYAANFMQTG